MVNRKDLQLVNVGNTELTGTEIKSIAEEALRGDQSKVPTEIMIFRTSAKHGGGMPETEHVFFDSFDDETPGLLFGHTQDRVALVFMLSNEANPALVLAYQNLPQPASGP